MCFARSKNSVRFEESETQHQKQWAKVMQERLHSGEEGTRPAPPSNYRGRPNIPVHNVASLCTDRFECAVLGFGPRVQSCRISADCGSSQLGTDATARTGHTEQFGGFVICLSNLRCRLPIRALPCPTPKKPVHDHHVESPDPGYRSTSAPFRRLALAHQCWHTDSVLTYEGLLSSWPPGPTSVCHRI